MGRAPLSASAFALAAGSPADPRAFVYAERLTSGRIVAVAVEPLEFSSRGVERGRLAIKALRDALVAGCHLDQAHSLRQAFALANAALIIDNRTPAGGTRDQPIYVGATAAVIDGRTIAVAQTPPAQAIIVQDRCAYALPRLASWRHDYVPSDDDAETEPLGIDEPFRPTVLNSHVASGDLLILCSSSIGRLLGRRKAGGRLVNDPAFLAASPQAAFESLESAVAASNLDDAFAAIFGLNGSLIRPIRRRRLSIGASRRQSVAAGETKPDRLEPPQSMPTEPSGADNHLRGVAASVASATHPWRRPAARTQPRRPAFGAPGAGSVRRYVSPSSAPAEWRATLPRAPELHLSSRWLTVGLIALVGIGGGRVYLDRHFDRVARGEQAIVRFDDALLAATNDPVAGAADIARAEVALNEALAYGVSPETLALRIATLDTARGHAWRVEHLDGLERIGVVPGNLANRPLRLFAAGGRSYAVGDAVYQVDAEAGQLVELLAPGTKVGVRGLAPIQAAAVDDGRLLVTDGAVVVEVLAGGTMQTVEMGGIDAFDWTGRPVAAFGGNFYGLSDDGQILRFGREGSNAPQAWTEPSALPVLTGGRDMSIDGRIHVLLEDGKLVTLFRGAETSSNIPPITPPLGHPAFFASSGGGDSLFVVEPAARVGTAKGRIVHYDGSGAARQYIVAASPTSPAGAVLAAARSVAIDETNGTVLIITDAELWRARLPLETSRQSNV